MTFCFYVPPLIPFVLLHFANPFIISKQVQLGVFTYVLVLEEAEHAQLPEDSLAGHEGLEHVGHLLERDPPAIPRIRHRPGGKRTQLLATMKL